MVSQASTVDTDVAIVGSGIAGALIALKLATAGIRVTILEAGPPVDRSKGPATDEWPGDGPRWGRPQLGCG